MSRKLERDGIWYKCPICGHAKLCRVKEEYKGVIVWCKHCRNEIEVDKQLSKTIDKHSDTML